MLEAVCRVMNLEDGRTLVRCRLCVGSAAPPYHLVKQGARTAAGEALLELAEFNCSAEVSDDGDICLCKSCYNVVMRLKTSYDDLEGRRASLREKLAKGSSLFRLKRTRAASSPRSRIPTPMRSPCSKRPSVDRPSSARVLFTSPLKSTPHSSTLPRIEPLLRPPSKPNEQENQESHPKPSPKPSRIPTRGRRTCPLPDLRPKIDEEAIAFVIDEECSRLCSKSASPFRGSSGFLQNFQWDVLEEEVKHTAPMLWTILTSAITPLGTTYVRKRTDASGIPACIMAAGILINQRSSHMCGVQLLLSLLLWHGHATTMTMERFNHLHLAVSPRTLHRRLEEIGSGFDDVVKQWMSEGSVFQIIGDNVDIYQRPRFMTTDHRPRMLNWFQVCAVKNRITTDLPDEKAKGTFTDAAVLPTLTDYDAVQKELVILIARVRVQYVPSLRIFQDLVPHHIVHKHSKEASTASCLVPLGVLLKNENTTEDMIDILEEVQQYVPARDGVLRSVFVGGDQLTCERIRGAKKARLQSTTPKGRLEGLNEKVEDWHALQAYYQVIWEELYSTKSSRDKCTLYQLRNLIDRRNITSDPKGNLHACQSFLKVVVESEILVAFAGSHDLKSLDVDITEIVKEGVPKTAQGKMQCITELASKVVECTALNPSGDLEPLYPSDDTSNYSSKLLGMGLLAWDFEDAVREGDGERILRLWKFLLLLFKQAGKTKYSIEAARLLCCVHVTLSEQKAYELMWNRTCSTHGGLGSTKSLDLALEHLNRDFKENVRGFHSHLTEKSVSKTAHAAPLVSQLISQFDRHLQVRSDSGYHIVPSHDKDRDIILGQLLSCAAFKTGHRREYAHFKGINNNPFAKIRQRSNWLHFQEWLDSRMKKMITEAEYADYIAKKYSGQAN